ncbi:MAG: MBL fold metallo-hydrolase [Lachnospiraceae bacterium]|nr:MBL fold metallo-hydrolase [Lachnospiraceae bacterium]
MKLTFVGAAHEVTGSCHYLEACGKHILLDCGMEQGIDVYENVDIPIEEGLIDYVLLSHAHIDHSGLLPLIYARGFRGQIMATEATVDLCSIMLRDSAHIQMQEAEWKNRKAQRSAANAVEPLYTMEDAMGAIRRLVPFDYDEIYELCDGIKFRFTDVGHLLGSASIEIWITEGNETRKLVFSGDIGNKKGTLIREPQYVKGADYVIMESTYGTRYHDENHPDYVGNLAKLISDTLGRGGNLVIPSFAVGRTQEMLYYIREIKAKGLVTNVPDFPVYVDSPLAVEATEIFKKNQADCFSGDALELVKSGINPLTFPGLQLSITSDESKLINFDSEPKVIISASGMCDAGRIRHHLKHNLWREESTILFVGYQAVGTLGRILIDGEKEIKLFGEPIEVRATIAQLPGMSGHADKAGLIEWIQKIGDKPRKVFVVHGDEDNATLFTKCLKDEYGYDAYAPYSGCSFDMITGEFITQTVGIPKKKKAKRLSDVFQRLLAAGQRLIAVIYKNEGGANKDLAKFADQINSLSDKWDR